MIGGGISGISLAHFVLSGIDSSDLELHLFEKRPSPGGLCQSISINDCLFDLGPHNIHSVDPWFNGYMKSLMGEQFRERSFRAKVQFRNSFLPYPMKGLDILKGVSPLTSAACSGSFLWSRIESLFREWKDDSFEDFIRNRFGRKLYSIYFGPFTEKTWGVPGSSISADFGIQRIGVFTLWDLFKRTFFGTRPKAMESEEDAFLNSRCVYPDLGSGALVDSLLNSCLTDRRFKLHTSSEVDHLEQNDKGFRVGACGKTFDAEMVFSSISLTELTHLLDLPDPGLVYISTRFLLMILDQETVFGSTPWVYFSDDRTAFNRVSEPRNMSPLMTPEGMTSLCVEFTTTGSDQIAHASEEELLKMAVDGLSKYGLLRPGAVMKWQVVDWENTYPLRTINYREATARAMAALEPMKNLVSHGRLGRFEYYNMDHCVAEAHNLAAGLKQRILEG